MRLFVIACALAVLPITEGLPQATNPRSPSGAVAGSLPLSPGQRVRISSPSLVAPMVANYLESRADTLVFFEDGSGRGIWSIPVSQLTRIEQTIGEQTRHRKFVVYGAGIGAVVGAVGLGVLLNNISPSDSSRKYNTVTSGLIGGISGGALGAYLGSRRKAEKWKEIPLPKRVVFAPGVRGQMQMSLAFSF